MKIELDQAVDHLSRTPGMLRTLLQGLPAELVTSNEGGNTWSPCDVLGHLIHGERTDWIPRARIILEEGETRAFDPFDMEAQFRDSGGKTVDDLLNLFEELRLESIDALKGMNLTDEDLAKTGRHPGLGRVTLGELLSTWVTHDLSHIVQISRTIAKQYSDAVGPWKAYMSVLK